MEYPHMDDPSECEYQAESLEHYMRVRPLSAEALKNHAVDYA